MRTNFYKFLETSITSPLLRNAISSGYSVMFEAKQLSNSEAFLSKFPISKHLASKIHTLALESVDCVELKHGTDPDSNFDPEQLKMGIEVEREHTDNLEVAEKIAKAHLSEDPKYYSKLNTLDL